MSDQISKRDGFGIGEAGRVPASDPVAEAEAERLQPTARRVRAGQVFMKCRRCGQTGYTGEYPFSTYPAGGVCDDCL